MSASLPRFVVVEGPIGAGKTTLARRLATSFGSELILEQPDENPFLERFYRDPRNGALPAQLFFLFQRVRLIETMRQTDLFNPVRVADFLLEKDRLFAGVTLDEEEFQLYEQVYSKLSVDVPQPDLVIYLQAPVEVLLERLSIRNISYERLIRRDYLERLMEAYARFFHDFDQSPLLIVNTAHVDLVDNEDDYDLLFREISRVRSGRHYFNPAPIV